MKESVMVPQKGALGGFFGNDFRTKLMEGLKLTMIAKVSDEIKADNL
jgi:hypothetical protein